jgi:hypothetical protein
MRAIGSTRTALAGRSSSCIPRPPEPPPALPKKRGREVAKIYKSERHLLYLDDLISLTQDIATALGNEVWPIYTLRFTEEFDH